MWLCATIDLEISAHTERSTPDTGDFTVGCAYRAGKEQWVWQVVQALLDVAAYPDIDTAGMCFNFWHRLSRMLTSGFHDTSPSALHSPQAMHSLKQCILLKPLSLFGLVLLEAFVCGSML